MTELLCYSKNCTTKCFLTIILQTAFWQTCHAGKNMSFFIIHHKPSAPLTLCLRLYQHERNYTDINPGGLGWKTDWSVKLTQLGSKSRASETRQFSLTDMNKIFLTFEFWFYLLWLTWVSWLFMMTGIQKNICDRWTRGQGNELFNCASQSCMKMIHSYIQHIFSMDDVFLKVYKAEP